ncbi:MAG: hypothetical protein ABI472_21680 [Ginsengibacter sp.]
MSCLFIPGKIFRLIVYTSKMKEGYLLYPANYFTTTINGWKPLLANDNPVRQDYLESRKIIILLFHEQDFIVVG